MDKSVEEMYAKAPLIRFSPYSQMQATTVRDFGVENLDLLEVNINGGEGSAVVNMVEVLHGRFWLWVLGAYEVIRTMDQHSACFSEQLAAEIKAFKGRLNTLRIPFAKQEIARSGTPGKPIHGENSIYDIDVGGKDLLYRIEDQTFSIRGLTIEFITFFEGIKPEDVKRNIQTDQPERSVPAQAAKVSPAAKSQPPA